MPGASRWFIALLAVLVTACGAAPPDHMARSDPDDESGLGGTGVLAREGLGGTGIVGEVTGFGSIFVNGIEVEVPDRARISEDGVVRPGRAFRRGEVVALRVVEDGGTMVAVEAHVLHEVVGPVAEVRTGQREFTILGQVVRWHGGRLPSPGEHVAVSGFRIPGGVVHATLVVSAGRSTVLLRGRLRAGPDGMYVGDQRVAGTPDLARAAGRRVHLHGRLEGGVLRVRRWAEAEALPFAAPVQRLVWQGHPEPLGGGRFRLPGTGLELALDLPAAGILRLELARRNRTWELMRVLPREGLPLGRPEPFRRGWNGQPVPRPGGHRPPIRPPAGYMRRGLPR